MNCLLQSCLPTANLEIGDLSTQFNAGKYLGICGLYQKEISVVSKIDENFSGLMFLIIFCWESGILGL